MFVGQTLTSILLHQRQQMLKKLMNKVKLDILVLSIKPISHFLTYQTTLLGFIIVKIAIYCPQGSDTFRQQLTILHVLHILHILHILHYIALSWTILHHLKLSCTILHYLAPSRTILHPLACPVVPIRYSCSQQMSPVIAFDIALVA